MEHKTLKLARPKEAAQYFGIGVSTLWLWLKTRKGIPPAIKAGLGVTLIDIPATEAFLRAESAAIKGGE